MVQPTTPADVIKRMHENYSAAQDATRQAAQEAADRRDAAARGEGGADASGRVGS